MTHVRTARLGRKPPGNRPRPPRNPFRRPTPQPRPSLTCLPRPLRHPPLRRLIYLQSRRPLPARNMPPRRRAPACPHGCWRSSSRLLLWVWAREFTWRSIIFAAGRRRLPRLSRRRPRRPQTKPNPLQKYVEVSGIRFVENAQHQTEARFVVVNHSDADITDLARHGKHLGPHGQIRRGSGR